MKKHLLFLPDFFLVMLIIFSCERIDLTEWRKSADTFPYTTEAANFQPVTPTTVDLPPSVDIWKDYLTEYKEKAKLIIDNFRLKVGEN